MHKLMRTSLLAIVTISISACAEHPMTPEQKTMAHIYDLGKGYYTPTDAYIGTPNPSQKAIQIALDPVNNPAGKWSCHLEYPTIAGHSMAPSYTCNWWRN